MLKKINFIPKLFRFKKLILLMLILSIVLLSPIYFKNNYRTLKGYDISSLLIPFMSFSGPSIANINIGEYSWNEFKEELNTVKFDSNIILTIEAVDDLELIKEAYYYISNGIDPLTQEEVSQISSWISYNDAIEISEEGFYIIYAKVVGYDDYIEYLNTDLLILDFNGPSINISIDDHIWSDLRDDLNYLYIDRPKSGTVEAINELTGISSLKYYITDQILSVDDLNGLSSESWITYTNQILIDQLGTHIIYVQLIDNFDYVTYVNSDYIVYDGYTETLIIGRDAASYLAADNCITNKSTFSLNFSYYNPSASDFENYSHNLISNILLPMHTKIILIDHINEKVYQYQIPTDEDIYNYHDSCDPLDLDCIKVATYPFSLFKEIGTGESYQFFFEESSYYDNGEINENFTIIVDLSNTDIEVNYNDVTLYMELHDSNGLLVRPTLYTTIEQINIYATIDEQSTAANLYLTTDYSGDEIIFNNESQTEINITGGISYKYINDYKIIDTIYENKIIGLSIKLVDDLGNIVDREYLKSVVFKIGNNQYFPEVDNIVRINLGNGINDIDTKLTIMTFNNDGLLAEGIYYFKISSYVSYDGHYYDELGSDELIIPVNVSDNKTNITYSFDVIMNDEDRIFNKSEAELKVSFKILLNGDFDNPNIKVALYKKNELTAYNQDYSIVDLADYVSDTLNQYKENIYYVSTDPVQYDEEDKMYNLFELNYIPANLENNGYKYEFYLCDDTTIIGTIHKYFVVRQKEVLE